MVLTSAEIYTVSNTGLSLVPSRNPISVYPNPSSTGMFRISGYESLHQMDLYDWTGRKIKSFGSTAEVDLREMPEGIYLLNAFLKDGSTEVLRLVR